MTHNLIKLIFLSFLCSFAYAETPIKSLPFIADQPGETYVLSHDLISSSGAAITVSADNIVIDGAGHGVKFAHEGAGFGILVGRTVASLEVKNIALVQGDYQLQKSEKAIGIYRNGSISGLNVHDSRIEIKSSGSFSGAYGHGISIVNNVKASVDNVIRDNIIILDGVSGSRGIEIGSSASGGFAAEIARNDISIKNQTSSPAGYPRAISLSLTGQAANPEYVRVVDNMIKLESSNDTIQGISLWQTDHVVVTGNQITTTANHARAILVDGESDQNYVLKNTITLASEHATTDASVGIRVRFGADDNTVYDNNINASDGNNSFPLRLGDNESYGHLQGNIFLSNKLSSKSRVISIETGSNLQIYGNDITSVDGNAVYFYCKGEGNCDNILFDNNTYNNGTSVRMTGGKGFIGLTNGVFCEQDLVAEDFELGTGDHSYNFDSKPCNSNQPTLEYKSGLVAVSDLIVELEGIEAAVRQLLTPKDDFISPPDTPTFPLPPKPPTDFNAKVM